MKSKVNLDSRDDSLAKCMRCGRSLSESEVTRGWKICNHCRAEERRRNREG